MANILKPPEQFPFPFPPYDIQEQLMTQVFQALEERKLAILESPTGTGKSLSLICGALSWLHEHNSQQKSRLSAELEAAESSVKQCEVAEDWFSAAASRHAHVSRVQEIKDKINRLAGEEKRLQDIKQRRKQAVQAVDGISGSGAPPDSLELLYRDLAKTRDTARRELTGSSADSLPPEEQELLLDDYDDTAATEAELQKEEEGCLKIYYCSRTHSQLSQFVGEVQKTVYGGAATRVVALAARQNLCINPEVARLRSGALINDRCLELQKKKSGRVTQSCSSSSSKGIKRSKSTHGCPYKTSSSVRALADQVLCEVQDLEEVVKRGKQGRACPYYAARAAVRDAQLVVVPYTSVLQASTRAACGITLQGNALIIDEAHNLLATLANVQEVALSYTQVCSSRGQVQQYVQRYESRLSARNLLYLNQILFCLKAFTGALTDAGKHPAVPAGELVPVAQFLSACRVENININTLLKYLDISHLPHKLHGFTQMFQGSIKISSPAAKTESEASDKTSTGSFLSKLATGKQNNKENDCPEVSSEAEQVDVSVGNPFLQVVQFLHRLVSCNSSGRILLHRDALLKNSSLKYIVLDPASHFHDMVRQCRSVILAGGTMKPMAEFRNQLFLGAGAPESRLVEYSCGHVVPADNIFPVALSTGPTGTTLDLTHSSRQRADVVLEVGRVLCNLSCVVPAGVVVFLPSYQYAQHLLSVLRNKGVIDRIATKKRVLEEPREASAVAAVLSSYSSAIRRAAAPCTGAMLFCVVGGKMSEGINFSDDMGRCVVMVGIPYPNSQSPELRERMRHLDTQQTSSVGDGDRSPGASYYHNLCFRAVNQSIGRAIRHKNDYATIVLLDQRYGRPTTIAALPDWISRQLEVYPKFGPAQAAIAKFFSRHKQRMVAAQQQ